MKFMIPFLIAMLPLASVAQSPLVAAEDVARVAAGLLTSSEVAAGATYALIGAVYTLKDIIETFGRVLGKDVRYEEISDDEWRSETLARGKPYRLNFCINNRHQSQCNA
jgi:uncharacterized protein YbjT (DUF2867 family)